MAGRSLLQRIQVLSDTYKQTLALIQELQKFPSSSNSQPTDLDEQRLELANTCHQNLKEAGENLELLRQEVENDERHTGSRRHTLTSQDEDHDRQITAINRLTEDLKHARVAFRKAQLQSKRNLDAAKRKEREELFADRNTNDPELTTSTHPSARRKGGQEKLTQDELARNAAEDVTKALRRTHALLAGNLEQSEFAQQTLEESQEQLTTLSDRYAGTTNLLQSSRGLVKQLITSQKSDTWYLKTTIYMLIATIGWLIFRRLLYGPLWWLVWFPSKQLFWIVSGMLGIATAGAGNANGTAVTSSASTMSPSPWPKLDVPRNQPGEVWRNQPLPAKGAGWNDRQGRRAPASNEQQAPDVDQKVQEMIEEAIDLEGSGEARNTKKRMMDINDEEGRMKDEL